MAEMEKIEQNDDRIFIYGNLYIFPLNMEKCLIYSLIFEFFSLY